MICAGRSFPADDPPRFHLGESSIKDRHEELINAAHDLYGDYSIFEVMDLEDRASVIERMVEMYGPPDMEKMEQCFAVFDQIREWREPEPS